MSFLLPFTVPSEDRIEKLGDHIVLATIFCLTEIGRTKGGLIRKRPPEEIVFITEACYPIWRAPWGKTCLLFDGLGLRKHTLSFDILPDVDVFAKEMQANSTKTETYLDFLTHNINYFQNFAGKGKKVINGLIADPALLKDFESHISQAKRVRGPIPDKIILSPFLDEAAIKSSVDGLSELKGALANDLRKLNKTLRALTRLTDNHIKLHLTENDEIRQRAEIGIARLRSQIFKKTEHLRRRYDKKILQVQKRAERQRGGLQEKCEKLEKRIEELTVHAEKCETEVSERQDREGNTSLKRWMKELERCRKRISETEPKVSEAKTRIKEVDQSRDVDVSRLEAEFEAQSEALATDLKRIEDTRDSKIAFNEERVAALKETTSTFITQINRLADLRRSATSGLNEIGLSGGRRKCAMIYLPFFLACYKQEFKRRYALFPPSFVHGMRGVTKIKGVFKTSKVEVILEDRSDSITKFLNRFPRLLSQSPIFEEKLVKAGAKTNMLGTKKAREDVAKGLERLRDEGWLSENEFRSLSRQLTEV